MIHHGDLFDVLPTLAADSKDACVTDPPYGIGFMGREWDTFAPAAADARIVENDDVDSDNPNLRGRHRGPASSPSAIEYDRSLLGQRAFQDFTARWAAEIYRVLKPGAYAVVCGAPRSAHRMACGLEDAGFEVRDCFAWLFGQGFPKSLDIQRAVDMSLCAQPGRHCMRTLPPARKRKPGDHVCPETELGRRWAGWGSGLKPAHEPIYIARKPLPGTLAENVMCYGVAALNVAACRLDGTPESKPSTAFTSPADLVFGMAADEGRSVAMSQDSLGRWPSNVLLDDLAAAILDQQSRGVDISGASRFFYVAKPSREERDYGCQHLPVRASGEMTGDREDGSAGLNSPRAGAGRTSGARNFHPTVKPIALMRWLVRLVTPQGGTVIDPFTGSGTTGMACRYEDRAFVGIERDADFVRIAEARIGAVAPLFGEVSA